MKSPTIVIPSAGRPTAVVTQVTGAILYVPESQADAYIAHNPGVAIETHPDADYKNLAAKRQGIYTRWRNVFMLDDDIFEVRRLSIPGDPSKHNLTPDEAAELIHVTAHNAEQAGAYLYGFNSAQDPKHYYPHKPIELTAYINACAIGLRDSPQLYFSERTTAAESHWINLLNAHVHRKAWSDMRFNFTQVIGSTFFRPGGQTAHRTLASEMADTLFLRRMFGQAVRVRSAHPGHANRHPYQRSIANPL